MPSPNLNRDKQRREKLSKLTRRFIDDEDYVDECEAESFSCRKEGLGRHDGHTIRRSIIYDEPTTNPTLIRHAGFSSNNPDSYGQLPVTEVDFLFDRGYVEANYYGNSRTRPIRQSLQSSEIVATLETLATNKTSSITKSGLLETKFDIPVCGYYMPITVDQLQVDNCDDAIIFAGNQEFIPNETKRPRRGSMSANKIHQEWRLHGGKSTKKNTRNNEGQRDKNRWLYYQGKYWDPSILYVFHPTIDDHCETRTRSLGTLHKLCPLQHTEAFRARIQLGPVDVDTNISGSDVSTRQKKTLTAAMVRKQYQKLQQDWQSGDNNGSHALNRLIVKTYTDKTKPRGEYSHFYNTKSRGNKSNKHLEIDLGDICELSHIGFLGGYPNFSDITTFPPNVRESYRLFGKPGYGVSHRIYQQEGLYRRGILPKGRAFNRQRGRRGRRNVYIVGEHALSYVKRFLVQYRDPVTHKWCDMGHDYLGNSDIIHEERHKISLQTRCIRVIPKEYHNNRDFTVLLYGQPIGSPEMTRNLSYRRRSLHESLIHPKNPVSNTDEDSASEYEDVEDDEFLISELKKPLNISECYEALNRYGKEEVARQNRVQTLRSLSTKQLDCNAGFQTKHQKRTLGDAIFGQKKIETISYTLRYHVNDMYDVDKILAMEDNQLDYDDGNREQLDQIDTKKSVLTSRGRYIRVAEGFGHGFYRDYYGQPSAWQRKQLIRKYMMEDMQVVDHDTFHNCKHCALEDSEGF